MEGNLLAGSTIQGGSYGMLDLQNSVSYLGEDAMADCHSGGRRKFAVLQKKGKWRSVSKVVKCWPRGVAMHRLSTQQ